MKMCVIIEEFLYAKKIENQTQRTLRGYKNTLNLFASWLEQKWSIDELENIRVSHLKQYVSYHLKVGHKGTYVNGIIKILRAFFKYLQYERHSIVRHMLDDLCNIGRAFSVFEFLMEAVQEKAQHLLMFEDD